MSFAIMFLFSDYTSQSNIFSGSEEDVKRAILANLEGILSVEEERTVHWVKGLISRH